MQVVDPNAPDVASAVTVHYEYDPYGNRVNAAASGEYDQPFRFSTKPLDAVTGLYYYGYRWYSPGLGRWISRDPLEEMGGANLHGFNQNAPPDVFDPLGLIPPFGSKADVEACAAVPPMIRDSVQRCASALGELVQACTSPSEGATTLPFAAGEGTRCSPGLGLENDLQRLFEGFLADLVEQNDVNASRLFEGCSGADVPLLGPAFTTFTGRRFNLLDLTLREVGREEHQSAFVNFSFDALALLACVRASAPRVAVGECGQPSGARTTMATGREWYDHFVSKAGAANVEWTSGSGRTITWPSELPRPDEGARLFHVRPRSRSSTFVDELTKASGPRPPGHVAHHRQFLQLNGVDDGATNGVWCPDAAHVQGHAGLAPVIGTTPYGTEFVILPAEW